MHRAAVVTETANDTRSIPERNRDHSISAVIPAYNAGQFVRDALISVARQTRVPDEVIVVDDCSTDDTAQLVRDFDYPGMRIRLLSTAKNSGSALARNLGIQAASGELIAFLDADDLWLPEHVATVGGLLAAYEEAALAFSLTEAFGDSQWIWPLYIPAHQPVRCFWECLRRTIIPQMNMVVRRSALLAVNGYRPALRQTQDFDLCLRLAYKSKFICTDKVTTRYRRHADSISARNPFAALGGEYISRHLFWTENQGSMDARVRERFDREMRDIWAANILEAWDRNDLPALSFHLSQHSFVPGSSDSYKSWRKRRSLFRLKSAWPSFPAPLRALIQIAGRPLVGRTPTGG
jgi:glycosyltransferase involved in cell wall biosynthesis